MHSLGKQKQTLPHAYEEEADNDLGYNMADSRQPDSCDIVWVLACTRHRQGQGRSSTRRLRPVRQWTPSEFDLTQLGYAGWQ